MLKKEITYTDFFGDTITEPFYFNLTKAELMEWELSIDGGLTAKIKTISKSKNNPEVTSVFKDLIMKSYGVKSPDGKHFIKSKELSEEFSHTEAYSELFMELIGDADRASEFVKKILPEIPEEELEKAKAELDNIK